MLKSAGPSSFLIRLAASSSFLLAALVLALAAVGLRPLMSVLAARYAKRPIRIARPLQDFDVTRLAAFRSGWQYTRLEQPTEELGTSEFVFIGLRPAEPNARLQYAEIFASYYSDPNDKVPHTPEVCYPPQGAVILKLESLSLDVPGLPGGTSRVPVRFVLFKWPAFNEAVMYCFSAEGRLCCDREQVRWIMGKPGNRRSYFGLVKVGARYSHGAEPGTAIRTCRTLLTQALPILLREHFPDAAALKGP